MHCDTQEMKIADPVGRLEIKARIPADALPVERAAISEEIRQCLYGLSMRISLLDAECAKRRSASSDTV